MKTDNDSLENRVRAALPQGKYHSIQLIEGGDGTRRAKFIAQWGINGSSRPVRIKVDKRLTDEYAVEMREKGYDTANDAATLSQLPYDEALAHGISPILDFEQKEGVIVTVEPEFLEAKSLGEFFDGKRPTKKEFDDFIIGLTRALKYAHEQGYYHRDITDRNLMIRKQNGKLETRLTDWEFAVHRDKVKDAPFTTTGSRSLRDPLLETQPYGDQSEIYQIAMNALTLFRKEPLTWADNGDNSAPEKRKLALKKELSYLPRDIRKKHSSWIERSLSTDPKERFSSFEEFSEAIDKALKPSLFEQVKNRAKTIAAVAGITGALAVGAGGILYGHNQKIHAMQIEEASTPRVETHWNGRGLEMFNDQVKLEVNLTGFGGNDSSKNGHQWYPHYNRFLRVSPGDKLDFSAEIEGNIASTDSNSGAFVTFPGRFYIEGERFDDEKIANEFHLWIENADEAKREYDHGYYNPSKREFTIPKDLKEGVYILATEIFAPTEKERTSPYMGESEHSRTLNNWTKAKIRFNHPNKVIARKRIPLVVGNPEAATEVYNIGLRSFQTDWYARKLSDDMFSYGETIANQKGIRFFSEVSGDSYHNLNRDTRSLGLPNSEKEREKKDLFFYTRDSQGRIIGFTAVPLESRAIFSEDSVREGRVKQSYMWDFGEVDRDFAERLVRYRENLPYQIELPKEDP